jgi:phosphoadenosine phosphosulfate reductase
MLVETHIDGYVRDKVATAIDRLRAFEPEEGYYLAFSGGKDSQCIYHIAVEAGVKFEAHYNLTTVDPPELVRFIKDNYPNVVIDYPKESMWKLIVRKKGPASRMFRYCCKELKEHGGEDRICVTGVRWAESKARKSNRGKAEIVGRKKEEVILFDDNEESRKLFENCTKKGKRVINPIIDWLDEDVWEYLNSINTEHCKLYDEGFDRLGCIGCPLAGGEQMEREFARWPKYKNSYLRAFTRAIESRKATRRSCPWENAEQMMDWWINETVYGTDYTESFLNDAEGEEI